MWEQNFSQTSVLYCCIKRETNRGKHPSYISLRYIIAEIFNRRYKNNLLYQSLSKDFGNIHTFSFRSKSPSFHSVKLGGFKIFRGIQAIRFDYLTVSTIVRVLANPVISKYPRAG